MNLRPRQASAVPRSAAVPGTAAALLLLTVSLAACRPAAVDSQVPDTQAPGGERSFTVRGIVRDVPADPRVLLIRHEEIPGYMPKMTMELTLLNTNERVGLQPGDAIEFRLVARADDHYIDTIRKLDSNAAPTVAAPAAVPGSQSGTPSGPGAELRVGDPAPDVAFLAESGKTTRLADYRGRAVAFTFFFTRCPLPDFCPRMNRHFQEARARLVAAPGPTNWSFVSISFDAEFDKPAVLSGYARAYRGDNPGRWDFVALDPKDLPAIRRAFDLRVQREEGTYSHNLRTVVLDAAGRVARMFDGNRWTPEELADAMTAACGVATAEAPAVP